MAVTKVLFDLLVYSNFYVALHARQVSHAESSAGQEIRALFREKMLRKVNIQHRRTVRKRQTKPPARYPHVSYTHLTLPTSDTV